MGSELPGGLPFLAGCRAQSLVQRLMGLRSVHPPVDICIVTQMHPSSNPRVVKEADALTAAGYNVVVIAPDYSAWGREADKEFDDRTWKLVERPRFGPLSSRPARLVELAQRAIAGVAVRNLGIEHPALLHAAWHPVAPRLIAAAKRQPASLYIGHLAGLPAAAIAAAHHGTRYAFDAEDFHPGDLPDEPEHAVANRMVRLIEGRHLPRCAYVTAASPGIADAYAAEYGIVRPTVILNTFPKANAPASSTPSGSARPGPSIYWFSQTIGHDRGLQCAVQAAAMSRCKPHLYLRGDATLEFADELRTLAAHHGISDHLHILPLAAPHQMNALAAGYDVGLCGEIGHTRNRRIALTNKQFTYLLAGIPALMSDIPAHRAFEDEAAGAVELFETDNATSLAQAIDRVLGDPERLATMRAAAWRLGQVRFNWGPHAERLVETVRGTLSSSSSPS
jgi:glycosyltransferase involved in cell wall biosynthesis